MFTNLPVASAIPKYSSSEGRHLTDEERQLLVENTRRLVEQFEAEYQVELERVAALRAARKPEAAATLPPHIEALRHPPPPSAEERRLAEARAKEVVRKKYGVDPELPGWRGLVLVEMRALLGKNAG